MRRLVPQRFWLIALRNALRSIKFKFVRCKKLAVQPVLPHMAILPKEQVEGNLYPFKNAGVDYFGPFEFNFLRRLVEHWCCLFTCLFSTAVHIEVVNGPDTDACLMAVTRFMARCGRRHAVISDNGTNLVGAARDFKKSLN